MLNRNSDKLEARSKLVYFVGYTKRTKEDQFYDPQEHTAIGYTYAVFLEIGYMINWKDAEISYLKEVAV